LNEGGAGEGAGAASVRRKARRRAAIRSLVVERSTPGLKLERLDYKIAVGVARASLDLTRMKLTGAGVEVGYERPALAQSADRSSRFRRRPVFRGVVGDATPRRP